MSLHLDDAQVQNSVIVMFQKLLDDEQGVSEEAYNEMVYFAELMEYESLYEMLRHVDATDGRFYLPEGYSADGKKNKKYTIEEIKYYLQGCILIQYIGKTSKKVTDKLEHNDALKIAIHELEDFEDGIEAVLIRRKQNESKST